MNFNDSKLFSPSKAECGKTGLKDLSAVPMLGSRTCVCCSTPVCFTITKRACNQTKHIRAE